MVYRYILFLLITLQLSADSIHVLDLKKEIETLKTQIKILQKNQKNNQKELTQNRKNIEEVSDYTESVETRVLEDKLKFGLGFKTNLDNFTKKYADGKTVSNSNIWSSKLMLNFKADITKEMIFYGRLSMYKYWGSSYVHPYSRYDNMQGRVPSNSSLFVERAYLNWFFNKNGYIPMAVTIGRQPSGDGPSHQFQDNTTRKATYSALLYDGAADGLVLTFNVSKLISNLKSYLRFGYAKGFEYSETDKSVDNAFIGASNNNIKDTNVYGLFFDTTLPSIKNSLVQLSYSKLNNLVANPLDTNTTQNCNIGNADMFGAMVEVTNLNNLDLFLHYGHIIVYPNSNNYMTYGGLLSAKGDTSKKEGDAVWIGGRYGFGENNRYKFGLEYNHGSKNWVSLTQGSFDVYNKLSTRGDAYETYLMYVVNRYTNLRLGYLDINYNYSRSGWFTGEPQAISSVVNPALEVKQLQSVYLKMSINY